MIARRKKLGDLCNLFTKGTTPTSVGFDFAERGVPFLRIQNISGSTVSLDNVLYIEENTHNALERSKIRPGDFLITIAGTIGRTAIVPPGFPESNCNQAVAILRFDEAKLWPRFLLYWLSTEDATTQISGRKVTATISNLSLGQIKELEIPLPPLPEQKRIAAILDKADAIRRKRQQAIQLADDFLRAVFLDMFGDPATNPKGWPVKRFEDIGKWASGGTPSRSVSDFFEGNINWFSAGELNSRYLTNSLEKISDSAIKSSAAKIFKKGSMLVGMYDTAALKISILTEDSSSNQACANVDCNALANVEWLYSYIDCSKDSYLSRRRGVRQKNLNLGMIREFLLPLPPRDLQDEFVKIVSAVFEIKKKQEECKDFPVFESLSQRAFSGQL